MAYWIGSNNLNIPSVVINDVDSNTTSPQWVFIRFAFVLVVFTVQPRLTTRNATACRYLTPK